MSGVFYEFDEVDEFSASAIGEPGSRVFYLSARHGRQRVTVRCEKLQVKAISTWLRNVLNDLPPSENRPMVGQPDLGVAPDHVFVLGPIGLGYDRVNDRLLVQLEELIDADVDEDEDGEEEDEADDDAETAPLADLNEPIDRGHIRFYVTRGQADAFCDHAERVVAAGRPPCQWCGHPIDPQGHACPRLN
jgi:uncharacterized repeat protein (TIGR03847 family)